MSVGYTTLIKPVFELSRNIGWRIVRQQLRPVPDAGRSTAAGLERVADVPGRNAIAQLPGQSLTRVIVQYGR
jgi:hypothetical protein